MTTEQLTARQIAEVLARVYERQPDRVDAKEWAVLSEAVSRLRRLERLVAGMLPELRERLNRAEDPTAE